MNNYALTGESGSLGNLKNWAELAGKAYNAYGEYQAGQDQQAYAEQAMAMSDPFGPYRPQAAQSLMNLEANPANFLQGADMQAIMDENQRRISRESAAKGKLYSGNLLEDLYKSNLGTMYSGLMDRRNQLADWAGASIAPNAGMFTAGATARQEARKSQYNLIGDIYDIGKTVIGNSGSDKSMDTYSGPSYIDSIFSIFGDS